MEDHTQAGQHLAPPPLSPSGPHASPTSRSGSPHLETPDYHTTDKEGGASGETVYVGQGHTNITNTDTITLDPNSQPFYRGSDTLAVNDLHWWTTPDHLIKAISKAGVKLECNDIQFAEHKVNGKSKGSVVISCHSADNASRVAHWFHTNAFQGRKLAPSFVNPALGNPFKPAAPAPSGPRPVLSTAALLAHGPTNAHGGVNFNRVRPAMRAAAQVAQAAQSQVGMGWPTTWKTSKTAQGSDVNYGGNPANFPSSVEGTLPMTDRYGRPLWSAPNLHPLANPFVPAHASQTQFMPFVSEYHTYEQ